MRMASFLRAASSASRKCAIQQFGGASEGVQPSLLNRSWERSIHSGCQELSPFPIWQCRGQQSMLEGWFARIQKSWASGAAAATSHVEESPKPKAQQPVVYRGPLSDTLRKVKLLSLTSCCLSVVTGPALVFLTSPHLSVILKGGVASAVMILSASTTAALHWFVGPYVHKMTWIPGSKEVEVEMVSWMATYIKETLSIEDIRPPKTNRPFVSFSVKNKFYFVDPEKIANKDLLRIVTFYGKK
ncbi:hypothetical protein GOP47_0003541 [Adiantum capillus-veneris]|uniref:Uncharacterized protein n=1 Tax=Adiantum capillus-veneris TaxID=13818 RepID=A0A9D4ZQ92_ADICA|nr:hypothetical protein GOP47_0003541 [Adiantum capillus-veneris]